MLSPARNPHPLATCILWLELEKALTTPLFQPDLASGETQLFEYFCIIGAGANQGRRQFIMLPSQLKQYDGGYNHTASNNLQRFQNLTEKEIGKKPGRDRFQGCRNAGTGRSDEIYPDKEEGEGD